MSTAGKERKGGCALCAKGFLFTITTSSLLLQSDRQFLTPADHRVPEQTVCFPAKKLSKTPFLQDARLKACTSHNPWKIKDVLDIFNFTSIRRGPNGAIHIRCIDQIVKKPAEVKAAGSSQIQPCAVSSHGHISLSLRSRPRPLD